ncbi:4'-phosphopantetheinyl transferase [Streptomyces humidus]|uniref:4'-phosphopantetheinyl transferase n=1 Tax=Streptomyces humidus TaxID=52259 RepID=A0A918FR77_9ACTN|nr:4'-phosphopantetheinyl transferase superfamily protein [Streptomyces humidus]GGR66049.1 4'-phosphopantetheinyl transferase [Streptomyces humidus]
MPAHPVHVWWAGLADAHPGLLAVLDPVERRRYEATVGRAGRERFLVGCALSRLALGGLLGLPPGDVPLRRLCPRCGGPHGKVRLDLPPGGPHSARPGLDFSVAHSGAVIGVAVCENARVGLDVEEADIALDLDPAARVALADSELAALYGRPPAERKPAFLCTWTRKEAVLKALGVGLAVPLRGLELSRPEQPPSVLAWPEQLDERPDLSLTDLLVDEVHPAAVAVAPVRARAGVGTEEAVGVTGAPAGVGITVRDGSAALAEYVRSATATGILPGG